MKIYEPRYYGEFRCIASACPDSCCKEWDVQVDPDSAARYRALEGPLGDRLRQVLVDRDGQTFMLQERGRCPMWQENGLCRIQSELGEEALCDVCTAFPRLRHDYGDFVELGLELSCPEAARLIFGDSDSDLLVRAAECRYSTAMRCRRGSMGERKRLFRPGLCCGRQSLSARVRMEKKCFRF